MNPQEVTGVILCGGQGRRLGGVEKPLIRVSDKALVEYVIESLRPQVSRILLSMGANSEGYQDFGCDLIPDASPYEGPLGGLVSCFEAVTSDWIQTCPGDAPWTAPDLVERLSDDAVKRDIAVAHDGQQRHNLTMLIRRDQASSLARFFGEGGRAVHHWLDAEGIPSTDLSDIASSFVNINTPSDLAAFRNAMSP